MKARLIDISLYVVCGVTMVAAVGNYKQTGSFIGRGDFRPYASSARFQQLVATSRALIPQDQKAVGGSQLVETEEGDAVYLEDYITQVLSEGRCGESVLPEQEVTAFSEDQFRLFETHLKVESEPSREAIQEILDLPACSIGETKDIHLPDYRKNPDGDKKLIIEYNDKGKMTRYEWTSK